MLTKLFLEQLKIELLMYKDGGYKKFISPPRIEWCSYIEKSLKTSNRFSKLIFDILKDVNPKLFTKCPMVAKVDMVQMKIPSNYISFLPHVKYKFNLFIILPETKTNVTVSLIVKIVD